MVHVLQSPAMRERRRGRTAAAATLAMLVAGITRGAHAATAVQAGAAVMTGATDNVLATPDDTAGVQSATFVGGRGTLTLVHDDFRSAQRATYSIGARRYSTDLAGSSLSQQGGLMAETLFDPRWRGALMATGAYGTLTTLDPLLLQQLRTPRALLPQVPTQTPGTAMTPTNPLAAGQPASTQTRFVAATASAGLTWAATGRLTASALSTFDMFRPVDRTPVLRPMYNFQEVLRVERDTPPDQDALTGRVGYSVIPTQNVPVMPTVPGSADVRTQPGYTLTIGEILASRRHALNRDWAVLGAAGLMGAFSVSNRRLVGGPAGRARISYGVADNRTAALEYAHTVEASVFLAQTMLADRISLGAALPLNAAQTIATSGSGSFYHGRRVSEYGALAGTINVYSAQAGLSYAPGGPFRFSLAYTFIRQAASRVADYAIAPFHQSLVMATLEATYPFEVGPRQPRERKLDDDTAGRGAERGNERGPAMPQNAAGPLR